MSITLHEVLQSEKDVLRNFYSLYLHDLSKFTSTLEISEEGYFEFDGFEKFWEVEGIVPYFIKLEERIIGFILLLERPFLKALNDFGINDIFILNKYKGKGLGREAVKQLFKEKPGKYFVMELIDNQPAVSFWKKLYSELDIQYEEKEDHIDDEPCLIQTFVV
ncbi:MULTISPECIES: GNAT family N-acetyltransferase [Sutcliffiella]|uniref:GNAT family N-acetyltransferase n=1 Tax=Sutcliffiella cohnii TaxID=33932 RepID=A0A223KVL2_9BACI|nr:MULTISPECIES: GNAT family N-acetyltransferase [Sutcliffiella]AST93491.1 GNAT family N-acetyltransferase [Sutcliffiella cohnii]WBL14675.1 GNAT family N-acetyltransferase [Sutcliffiella sp. NC1]